MRPKPIIWFERALLAAAAIDLLNNLIALPMLRQQLVVSGAQANSAVLFAAAFASPLIAVLFWYFIARRGSAAAKWVLTLFIGISVVLFATQLGNVSLAAAKGMLMAAVISEVLKVYAVICLFLPAALPWFRRETAE